MAKGGAIGKLGKLKCMIKRWQTASGNNRSLLEHHGGVDDDKIAAGLHPVYVGKSRRRYLRSGGDDGDGGKSTTVVGCEVVLFEHLLWMLENADPQPESLDELVEFYAC
ncbi:unnamed protein product [Spirodela intermedia]|uniref:Uncharacterized protein n=1 Tax=Spirodela intermedia TaxID=51605 RepID=A0A7I8J4A1_SPIIN|nr:unnamed protein product [Spirodela intermedia]CAA6664594.1 unnamed protein product [Spirodela intermedia]